jgi:undecaprenyl-diphosphatase
LAFVEILKTIIIGIVEGITEWLPISSTGHIMIFENFMNYNMSDNFKELFDVVIQLGAIMAVVVLYFHKLNPFAPSKSKNEKIKTVRLWVKVIVACLPAAVIGLLLDDWLSEHIFTDAVSPYVIAGTLIFYGIVFIVVENYHKNKKAVHTDLNKLPYKTALGIGIAQVLSIIPGTSRSGSTILGGIMLGTSRYVATEFTFFLAIPVMFGASLLKCVKYVMDGFQPTGLEVTELVIGMLVSFIISIVSIKFLLNYIKRNSFKAFGIYRIIAGAVILIYALTKGF